MNKIRIWQKCQMIYCFQHKTDFLLPRFHLLGLFIVTYACRNLTFPNSKNCECIKSPAVFDLIKLSFHSSFVIWIQSKALQSGRAIDGAQPWNQMYHTWWECCVNVCPSAMKHYTTVSDSPQIWLVELGSKSTEYNSLTALALYQLTHLGFAVPGRAFSGNTGKGCIVYTSRWHCVTAYMLKNNFIQEWRTSLWVSRCIIHLTDLLKYILEQNILWPKISKAQSAFWGII